MEDQSRTIAKGSKRRTTGNIAGVKRAFIILHSPLVSVNFQQKFYGKLNLTQPDDDELLVVV